MHQCLREDDGMNILGFGSIALANCHLTRAAYQIAHYDKQIVHYRREEQHEGHDAQYPAHHLDVWVMGIDFAQHREIKGKVCSHLPQFLQREMVLTHLVDVRLEFVGTMSPCQPDVGNIAIISYPIVSAIVRIYVWNTGHRQNHLRAMQGRPPRKSLENAINGKSSTRIIGKREMLAHHIAAYSGCRLRVDDARQGL